MSTLGQTLERLLAQTDVEARLAADPVGFVHRYTDPVDREVAAVLAGVLAYGRVAAFGAVLEQIFAQAQAHGGPRRWVDGFDPKVHADALKPLVYRWNRGIDFVLLLAALRRAYERVDSLEVLLGAEPLPQALDALICALRGDVVAVAPACGVDASTFDALPRGTRYLLPRPAGGSATKRWWMVMRWMIRRPTMGIDFGQWTSRSPAELVIPLDTHVLRLSQFLGWTRRKDGSLRTALEVTAALRVLDPHDPVRYDFALAHLGISGACKGHRDHDVCGSCPLDPVCTAT